MSTIAQSVNSHQKPHKVIEVSDIARGDGNTIATFTLRVGGFLFNGMELRQGRKSVYLNFPSRQDKHGRWIHLVEVLSPSLERFIQETCFKAVSEALR